ncbi:MAG: hypothetical protein NZ700_15400 [Gemmataceae bacterium]|nr:hypothetical protein [Gemmataceae bacterium]MDW8265882.1 hypothetical protein [Gemmataceae bacterium]
MLRLGARLAMIASFALGCLAAAAPSAAQAAQARFRYVPVDAQGNTTLQPFANPQAPGELTTWFGLVRQPYPRQPRPTRLMTYQHPFSGRSITVPLALPEGTPIIQRGPTRIAYNYGSYVVAVQFLPDGSVDVVYNSGWLRGL